MTRFNFSANEISQAAAPIEHAAAHAAVGVEQGALAALHAAAEPISPIIQMIMRMPGQIGLISSCFEAFGNFFFSQASFLAHLDPSLLTLHAHISDAMAHMSLPGGEHMAVDASLLPHGAPILQAHAGGEHLFDMKGGLAHQDILKDSVAFRDQLKVSGQMDLGKPQFEAGRGLSSQVDGLNGRGDTLSGPFMRDVAPSTHLAQSGRLFSDQLSLGKTAMNSNIASSTPAQPVSSSMNVGGTPLGTQAEAAPAVGQISDAAPQVAGAQNVSGSTIDMTRDASTSHAAPESSTAASSVGDGKQLIADNSAASNMNFRPTVGAEQATGYDASYLQQQGGSSSSSFSSAAQTHAVGGMKAQQMSLNGGEIKPAISHPMSAHPAATHLKPAESIGSSAKVAAHSTFHYSNQVQIHHGFGAHANPANVSVHHGFGAHNAPAHVQIAHRAPTHVQYDQTPVHGSSPEVRQPVQAQPMQAVQPRMEAQPVAQAQPAMSADGQQLAAASAPNTQQFDGQQIAQVPGTDAAAAGQAPGTDAVAAGQAPATGVGAAAAAPSTYTIRAGDCLWNIAKDHLHSATRWSEIYKMNTDVIGTNPALIHPGQTINLPGSESNIASNTGLENGEYIVKSGDNLWDISKHFSGDGSKWTEIYKANSDVIGANPDLIMPGQHLHIPGADTATVADAPAAATQQVASATPSVDPSQAAGGPDAGAAGQTASAPTSLEAAAAPQAPVQSYSSADLSQAAPTQLSQAAAPAVSAPIQAAPMQAAPLQVTPAAAMTTAPQQAIGGPGAASAGELHGDITAAEISQAVPQKSVVSSSLAPAMAQFMRGVKP